MDACTSRRPGDGKGEASRSIPNHMAVFWLRTSLIATDKDILLTDYYKISIWAELARRVPWTATLPISARPILSMAVGISI